MTRPTGARAAAARRLALPALPLLLLLLLAATAGCGRRAEGGEDGPTVAAGHDHEAGPEEASDLDRPVEELFSARCEHDVPTHRCRECRYEVGVVEVAPDLIERGLVAVDTVRTGGLGRTVTLTGVIRFDERRVAHLGPRLPGVVQRVLVDLGRRLEPGEPLLELDSPELARAEAAYLEALAVRRLAERTHGRKAGLREAGIGSEREFLEAEQALEAAAIRANGERQRLLRLGIGPQEIADLEAAGIGGASGRHLLRAPFAGEVLALHAVRGEWVEPGAELALFGDIGSLWLWVDLYEADLAAILAARDAGDLAARAAVPAFPGESFPGRLDLVERTMDEHTRTVRARVALENPRHRLRPGMFATVALELGGGGPVPAVPEAAVLDDEGREFVFVHHEGDFFVRRPVATGRRAGGRVEITGVRPGQVVVTTGGFLLKSDVLREKMGEGCAH